MTSYTEHPDGNESSVIVDVDVYWAEVWDVSAIAVLE